MEPPRTPTEPKQSNSWLKYSGLGIQLFGSIGVAAWLGHLLDIYLNLKFPAFLLSFVMLTFGGMLYLTMKQLNKE